MDLSYRERYVERLNLMGAIISPNVECALREVPFHRLINSVFIRSSDGGYREMPGHQDVAFGSNELGLIYSGIPLVLSLDKGVPNHTTLSAPVLVQMLESLELERGMRILEIGNGGGYFAALIGRIVGSASVYTVSNREQAVDWTRQLLVQAGYPEITLVGTDGFDGYRAGAPFDRIVVSVGYSDLSPRWLNQLGPTGFLIVPLDHGGWFPLIRVWRRGEVIQGRVIGSAGVTIDREDELSRAQEIWWIKELNKGVQEQPPWDGMSTTSLRDFWFFVSIQNPHTGVIKLTEQGRIMARGFGIDDPQFGWSMIVSGSGGLLGQPQALPILNRLYEEWRAFGSPRMADYDIELLTSGRRSVPRSAHSSPIWTRERRRHSQRTQLTRQ